MDYHRLGSALVLIIMEYRLSWTIVDYHGLLWIIDYNGLSWIIMDYE